MNPQSRRGGTGRRYDGPVTSSDAPAAVVASRVGSGALSAVAVADATLARIAAEDPGLRSFAAVCRADARADASRVDAMEPRRRAGLPLAGVPIGVKDEFAPNDPLVARLGAAGAVTVGWTATPELCVWPSTDSGRNGITRNPWDRELSSGGSSGGSAAAVAAGLVPLAIGSDGMGSLRIPAAACGVVTIKPGRGFLPDARPSATTWGGLSEPGPLATSVTDLALGLSVMAAEPGLATPGRAGSDVRVGVSTASPLRLGIDLVPVRQAWVRAAREAAEALRSAGLSTVDADPPGPDDPFVLLARWTSAVARKAEFANLPVSAMERRNRHHALLGRTVFRRGGVEDGDTRWNRSVDRLRGDVERVMDDLGVDVWLTPTLADVPMAATEWHERSWGRNLWASMRSAPFCSQWNLLGWPAMSVPCGTTRSPAGRTLPTAVQLVGRPESESLLLSVAATVESVSPWQPTIGR